MQPLHVLHVIDELHLGGAERMAVDVANETARRGHRVTMCITRMVDHLANELRPEIEVLRLRRSSRYDVVPLTRLVRLARRERVDIVHVHMRSSLALMLPLRASHALNAPIVFHDHFGGIEDDTSVPRWIRIGRRWIDQYVGVSPALGAWAHKAGLDAARIHVIENALDLTRLSAGIPVDLRLELGLGANATLALMVATIRRDKGIETALEALAQVADPELHLAIAGVRADADYEAMLRTRCRELGLEDRVSFLGGRRDVPGLLRACDLAISASHTESGPLVLIEFAFAGAPFVATRVGQIGRRFADAGLPGFVAPRDPSAMATAIRDLRALTPAARATRIEQARSSMSELGIQQVFPRWLDIYQRARATP